VGNEVGVEVLLVAEAAIPLPVAEKVVSVTQDEGSDDVGSNDGKRIKSDDSDDNSSDDGEDKAMCIPFRMTPSRIMWYKCPICLK
jgi:hypothetical protein